MALECVHDWDAVIATFEHPRYEMHGPGTVFDGETAVRGYFACLAHAVSRPRQRDHRHRPRRRHGAGRVLADRHAPGPAEAARPHRRGHRQTVPAFASAASFEFPPGGDKIVCERPYCTTSSPCREPLELGVSRAGGLAGGGGHG
ncbi:nuclear transport factor 2 family protein [Caulobacter segnis]